MTAATANTEVVRLVDQELREFPVGVATIYKSAFVGVDPAGYVKDFEPGDLFVGIAYEEADNSAGSAGDLYVKVFVQGDFEWTWASAALTDAGKALYATDDATLALAGHPDAYVGRCIHKDADASGKTIFRMKTPGEKPLPTDLGSLEIFDNFKEPFAATGAAADIATETLIRNGLILTSELGLGISPDTGVDGGATMDLDATAEVASNTIKTVASFNVAQGLTFEAVLHLSAIGDDAALDVDWGIGTDLDATMKADLDDASMAQIAAFHLDGATANILCTSDDATTDVAPVDSTVDNVVTANNFKKYKIIVRKAGTVEFWIDGARVLATTSFALLTSATALCGFVNQEKTSNDTVGVVNVQSIRMAGAHIVAAGL